LNNAASYTLTFTKRSLPVPHRSEKDRVFVTVARKSLVEFQDLLAYHAPIRRVPKTNRIYRFIFLFTSSHLCPSYIGLENGIRSFKPSNLPRSGSCLPRVRISIVANSRGLGQSPKQNERFASKGSRLQKELPVRRPVAPPLGLLHRYM